MAKASTQEVAKVEQQLPATQKPATFSLVPKSLDEAMQYADIVSKSEMVPPDYKGKPANCLIAMQMGMELGLPPLQAIQNIAVVNGRPAVWGDMLPAVAKAHPKFEYMNESFDESTMTASCTVKRRNEPEQTRTFSQADATTAGLWGRNTWKNYPKRMLQMRARGFAIRDVFPDALKGCSVAEEIIDLDPKDYSTINTAPQQAPVEQPEINEQQVSFLKALISDNGLDEDKWLNWIERKTGTRSFESIPVGAYSKVESAIQQAVSKQTETAQ